MMRCWIVLFVIFALSCSRQNYLTITVENLPATARSILALVASGDKRALALAPLNRTEGADLPAHFVLALPAGQTGPMDLAVGAYQQPDAQGCLLAAGMSSLNEFKGPRQETFVTVSAVSDMRCGGKSPILLDANPHIAKTEGGELVDIIGFGFQHGAIVTIAGAQAVVKTQTFQHLGVIVPKYVGFGPVEIQVQNPDQGKDNRRDLLNLYNPVVNLGKQIFKRSNCVLRNAGGMTAAPFYPDFIDGLAVSKSTEHKLDLWGFDGVADVRRDIGTIDTPTNIASADFDNDGDYDLVVTSSTMAAFQILLNEPGVTSLDTKFNSSMPNYGLSSKPLALAIGDLNQDGSMDIVLALDSLPASLVVWLNDGSGHFSPEGTSVELSGTPVSMAIGRIDNDIYPDIVISATGDTRGKGTRILFNQVTATPRFIDKGSKGILISLGQDIGRVLIGDINGDKLNDIIASSGTSGTVFSVINRLPDPPDIISSSVKGSIVKDIFLRDMNGDGQIDLISACRDTVSDAGMIEVFLSRLGIGFGPTSDSSIASLACTNPTIITTLSSRRNGRSDIVFIGTDTTNGTPCNGMLPEACLGGILNDSM